MKNFSLGKNILIATALFSLFSLFSNNDVRGQGEVPVRDAEVVRLLNQLVRKELTEDPNERRLAGENLNLVSEVIIRDVLKVVGRGEDQGNTDTFVQNWRNFSLGGQYRGEDLWRGLLYTATNGDPNSNTDPLLCKHIRESQAFRSLLPREVPGLTQSGPNGINRRVGDLQEYLVNTKCDQFVEENFDTFAEDFSAGGGWEMFKKMLQPKNNIFGALNLAFGELDKQRSLEEQADIQEATSASGYLGQRQCLAPGPSGQCTIWSNINIPANLAVETLGVILNQNLGFIAGADEKGEAGAANATIEITKLIELIFGVRL